MPASALTNRLSNRNSRNTLARDAPSDMRRAISRRRPLKRASKRLATLLHAISSTRLTAANRVVNAGRRLPVTSSGISLIDEVAVRSTLLGYAAA